jgi:protein-export membrane protein SecD
MAKLKERTKVRLILVLILVIAVVLGMIDYPKYVDKGIDYANAKFNWSVPHIVNLPFHLGLDLQGGTHLVYEADTTAVPEGEEASSVEGVRDVIERRVNAFGVAEPVVQTNQSAGKWRVIVELAGIKDVEAAIKMIGETPLLEFKEQNTEPPRELTEEEKVQMETYNKEAEERANALLQQALDGADFNELVKEHSEDIFTQAQGGDLGIVKSTSPTLLELYNAIDAIQPQADTLLNQLIEDQTGFNIVKITQVQDGDTEVKANHLLICYQGAERCEQETTREEAEAKIRELKDQANPDNFVDLVKENSTEPGAETSGGDLGFFARGQMVPEFEEAVFNMEVGAISDVVETDFGFHLIYKAEERQRKQYGVQRLLIETQTETDILPPSDQWKNTELSGKQLRRAQVTFDQVSNEVQVSLEFNDEGKDLFGEITSRNVGKPVAIFLDGEPISIPTVNEAITGGQAVITGSFDVNEAKLLSQRLNAGALPVPINLVSQQTIGAALGAESLQKSLMAGLVGLILIILFMLFYYRLPGLLAIIALGVYATALIFLFKLIPVTLTLAGIAGFILSLGLAVDANVLIFERLKEELRMGKPLGSAVDEGFKRAWPSIRDGNVSTLITCFILFWFGTSTIRGFAVTLGIGIIVSMFSAIVITRLLLKSFVSVKTKSKGFLWFGIKRTETATSE